MGVEIAVLLVGKIGLFTDHGRSAKDNTNMFVQQFIDDGCIKFFKLVRIGSRSKGLLVPYIIYTDKDEHHIRVKSQHIVPHTQVKVIYLVAPETRADQSIWGP